MRTAEKCVYRENNVIGFMYTGEKSPENNQEIFEKANG